MSTMTENLTTVSVTVGDQEMTFETGKLAKQADGSVVVRAGDTMVLATAQGKMEAREGADFFPLTVDVEERMYAAGKIPGGFFKREGRPTERAILTARMIDRPIRPLWPKGYKNEVHVVCTTLSADLVTAHDILCINGASAALMVSPLPFLGPVGAVRIGRIDGQLVDQPDAPGDRGGQLSRPDRRRDEGRADDDRGGRRRDPRGRDARSVRARPRGDRQDLRGAGRPSAPGGQAEVPRPGADRRARVAARRPHPREHPGQGPARGRSGRRGADGRAGSRAEHGVGRGGHPPPDPGSRLARHDPRESSARGRRAARPRAVRGRPACADRGRAGLEGAQVGEARAAVRPDHRVGRAAVPGRPGDRRRRGPGRQGLADQAVRQEGVRGDLQAARPPEDRHRQAASRRTSRRGRPRRHLRGPRRTTRTRVGPLHPRPDADHVAAHARNGERGAANRRPLARDRPPVHAPLQLPALLGGRDRLHARAEAPRHRARCARPAGARADDPAGGGLPVHDPHRLGDARVERLLVDGLGLRLDARAHGRRSADQGARQRHRHGPRQGRRRARDPHRHPGRRGSPR